MKKKLPLGFCLLLCACSAQKQVINNSAALSKYQQPYHVYAVGKWNTHYMIYTLVDARNKYFSVKGNYNSLVKRGDVYNLSN